MYPDNHNPIPSLEALAKFGIPRSSAIYLQNNYWNVPSNYLDIFGAYYILRWDSAYFREALHDGLITRHDISYQVVYHRTNPAEIKKATTGLLLSFRVLKEEYKVHPVVLVSLTTPNRVTEIESAEGTGASKL